MALLRGRDQRDAPYPASHPTSRSPTWSGTSSGAKWPTPASTLLRYAAPTYRCDRSRAGSGSAGSAPPKIVYDGTARGSCITRVNRRPSSRIRDRNSHRWYSKAQWGEGHWASADWYVLSSSPDGND